MLNKTMKQKNSFENNKRIQQNYIKQSALKNYITSVSYVKTFVWKEYLNL